MAIEDSETVHMRRRVTGWKAVYGMFDDDPDGYDAFLPIDLAVEDLGIAARAALEASRVITPDHPQWNSIMRFPTKEETAAEDSRPKAQAGIKTLSALYNGAGMASLRMIDGRIEITPLRYRASGHWEGIKGSSQLFSRREALKAFSVQPSGRQY